MHVRGLRLMSGEYRIEHDVETETAITNAISQIMSERRNEMVTKAIVLVEVMNEHGERALFTGTTPGIVLWDEEGMLSYALDKVRNYDLMTRLAAMDDND